MGALNKFKSLFFPQEKPKKKKVSSKKTHLKVVPYQVDSKSSTLRDKQEIEFLRKKIAQSISSPEGSKKAALIIEKMINKK